MTVFRVPVNLSWSGSGSPGVNVWSVRVDNAPLTGDSNLQEAVTAIHTFYDSVKDIFQAGTTITLGDIVERNSQTFASASWTTITGNNTGFDAAPVLQIVVSWKTTLAARRGMGRTFLGPLCNDNVENDGTIVPARLTEISNAATALVNNSKGNLNGWAVGVWGYQNAKPPKPQVRTDFGRVHRDIVGYKVRDRFAVLRSRRD